MISFRIWFVLCPLNESLVGRADPLEGVRRHALPPEDADDELGLALRVAVYVVSVDWMPSELELDLEFGALLYRVTIQLVHKVVLTSMSYVDARDRGCAKKFRQ